MKRTRPPRDLSLASRLVSQSLVVMIRASISLPYRQAIAAGALLGRTIMRTSPKRVHIARTNLRLCFPDLTDAEREDLLRRHFRALGIGVLETGMAWFLPDRRLEGLIVDVEGRQYLEQARADGKGVILLSAHVTSTELGVRLLNLVTPVHPMYREHENPVLRQLMHGSFKPHFDEVIQRNDVRGMLKSLRRGNAVWYAPDQNYGRANRVFAPFFGVQAATNAATGRFARMGNAVVIPYFPRRLPDDSGYRLVLMPHLEDFPGMCDATDAARVNGVIEAEVRLAPEQYLWVHRRFKTRPEGEPDLYGT